jgi:hypothetical protein
MRGEVDVVEQRGVQHGIVVRGDGEAGEQILFVGMVALPVGSHVSLWREEKQKAKPLSPLNFHPATLR